MRFGDAPGVDQTHTAMSERIGFPTREEALDPGAMGFDLLVDLAAGLDCARNSSANLRSLPFGEGGMKEKPFWRGRSPVSTPSICMDVPNVVSNACAHA